MKFRQFNAGAHQPQARCLTHHGVDKVGPMDDTWGRGIDGHGQVGREHDVSAFGQTLPEPVIEMLVGFNIVPHACNILWCPAEPVLAHNSSQAPFRMARN